MKRVDRALLRDCSGRTLASDHEGDGGPVVGDGGPNQHEEDNSAGDSEGAARTQSRAGSRS